MSETKDEYDFFDYLKHHPLYDETNKQEDPRALDRSPETCRSDREEQLCEIIW